MSAGAAAESSMRRRSGSMSEFATRSFNRKGRNSTPKLSGWFQKSTNRFSFKPRRKRS
jgi:hypothetical protein